MERRAWILGGTLAVGAAAGGLVYQKLRRNPPGPLEKALTKRSGPFMLMDGFECVVLSRAGEKMSDGARTANLPDGMACFPGAPGQLILMRNHELMTDALQGGYPEGQPTEAFNQEFQGGVSRLVVDQRTLKVISSNMVLTGTLRNCGGGVSPWGWITCEETSEPGHGYSFLCRTDATKLGKPQILKNYGRFRHEGVAIDPLTLRSILTEDEGDACLYRFTPRDQKTPFSGKLEALRVRGKPNLETGSAFRRGMTMKVDWVPVPDPLAREETTRAQAQKNGAALFSRTEGIWLDGDGVVFTATTGGRLSRGQIFRLAFDTNELTLVAESEAPSDFNGPDNITVAPWGDLLIAEDGRGPQHVFGITKEGNAYPLLRNDLSNSEISGLCFSPDGTVLFCNVQDDGLTVAIRGPWDSLRRSSGWFS